MRVPGHGASAPFVGGGASRQTPVMSTPHKPEGYPSISPYLVVNGAARTIEFMKDVFEGIELRRFPDAEGKVRHAEVRIDDSVVMVADSVPGWPALSSHVHVYVRDVDATYRRALAAGATSVQEPIKKDDEDKRGGVKDRGGTTSGSRPRVGDAPQVCRNSVQSMPENPDERLTRVLLASYLRE